MINLFILVPRAFVCLGLMNMAEAHNFVQIISISQICGCDYCEESNLIDLINLCEPAFSPKPSKRKDSPPKKQR